MTDGLYSTGLKMHTMLTNNRQQRKFKPIRVCAVCLLHDNARPHTAHKTEELLKRFKWEVLDNPPYRPDLVPSDFHIFLDLKRHLAGQNFHDDDEIKNEVEMWF
ncbi:hypothetical protein AVEN_5387-1 [Araneus ventricosus]|uniref:Histone-lysine N-methyltransferase SETMAR n=1 Tax=Araneus ventricosus TaxID=182803 RepID=A0A4Y2V7C8_ARAVE|nr:hypothetical protein AVEN_5387-1 [Araneus ventricosus]